MGAGEPLQRFTALGTITSQHPYQVEMRPDFRPWRLAVDFEDVTPTPIQPLLAELSFITDPKRWGFPFRRGLFEIEEGGMDVIRSALQAG